MTTYFRVLRLMLPASAVAVLLLSPRGVPAQDYVVPRAELRGGLLDAAAERRHNIERLENLLASDLGKKALAVAGVDASKVEQAISHLSDAELARLTAQADQVESDFAAGLTTRQVTLIIFAATIVAVLILVALI